MIIRKFIILCVFSMVSQIVMADFAIISDPDGYANIRADSNINAKIVSRVNNGEVLYCSKDKSNGFHQIAIGKNTFDNSSLYIHYSRAKFLSSFTTLPILRKFGKEYTDEDLRHPKLLSDQSLTLAGFNYQIHLLVKPFNVSNHRIIYNEDKSIDKLDNFSMFWGSDQQVPYSEYSLIRVNYNNIEIAIPKNQISDLFNPNLSDTKAFFDGKTKTLYLVAQNGDGAGVYHVVLIFKEGKYVRRLVVMDENV